MFEMFPNIDIGKDAKYPLSSYLFGHRMRPNQSDIEYLIAGYAGEKEAGRYHR